MILISVINWAGNIFPTQNRWTTNILLKSVSQSSPVLRSFIFNLDFHRNENWKNDSWEFFSKIWKSWQTLIFIEFHRAKKTDNFRLCPITELATCGNLEIGPVFSLFPHLMARKYRKRLSEMISALCLQKFLANKRKSLDRHFLWMWEKIDQRRFFGSILDFLVGNRREQ